MSHDVLLSCHIPCDYVILIMHNPYDHFLVYSEVEVLKKNLEHVTEMKYLQKYEPGRLSSKDYNSLVEK